MFLQSCCIKLIDEQILVTDSVEHSLGLLETRGNDDIAKIKIKAIDGYQVRSYSFDSIEETIESLMNL